MEESRVGAVDVDAVVLSGGLLDDAEDSISHHGDVPPVIG